MDIYGLIGFPLEHSFSAAYFSEKFAREGIEADYRNFPLHEIEEFNKLVENEPELHGLNVTIPYKQQVIPYLDSISDDASQIGAVNTICFTEQGTEGHNTDWVGFRDSIKPWLDEQRERPSALILGKGGAALAIAYALSSLNVSYRHVSRSPVENDLGYDEVSDIIVNTNHLIINTTPLGTFPDVDHLPDLPYTALTTKHLLYDLVYNPGITAFLARGNAMGAMIMNGLEMLHRQAEASWTLWQNAHRLG